MGALITVSHMQLPPDIIRQWLEEKNPRQRLIFPAPPQGLYLTAVHYPQDKLALPE